MFTQWFRKPTESVAKLRAATGLPISLCKLILERLEPSIHSKVLAAMESQVGPNLFHDPIEDDPDMKSILDAADSAADAELGQALPRPGRAPRSLLRAGAAPRRGISARVFS